jgi:peptidoglycan/LPS O-acetylase OafA/YrhL
LLLDLVAKFAAGALIYQWRLRLRWEIALGCLAITIACLWTNHFQLALRTVFPYAVMYLAIGTNRRLPGLTQYGDLSYGMYIYAWPIEQMVVMYSGSPHWLITGSIATVLVLAMAFLSWHGVEQFALSLKRKTRPGLIPQSKSEGTAEISLTRMPAPRLDPMPASHRRSPRRYRVTSR